MSIHEYARREEQEAREAARQEERVTTVLAMPTPPITGPDALEEHAELLVRQGLHLRELAAMWRQEVLA